MRSKIKIEVKNYSSSVRRVGSARHRKEQVSESSETEIESDVTAPAPPPQSVSTQSHAEGVQGTVVAHAAQALMLGHGQPSKVPPNQTQMVQAQKQAGQVLTPTQMQAEHVPTISELQADHTPTKSQSQANHFPALAGQQADYVSILNQPQVIQNSNQTRPEDDHVSVLNHFPVDHDILTQPLAEHDHDHSSPAYSQPGQFQTLTRVQKP